MRWWLTLHGTCSSVSACWQTGACAGVRTPHTAASYVQMSDCPHRERTRPKLHHTPKAHTPHSFAAVPRCVLSTGLRSSCTSTS